MPYYPETTVVRGLVRIHRERKLPPMTISRQNSHLHVGMPIEAMNVVLQGDLLKDYRIIDVGRFFNTYDAERLEGIIQVEAGNTVKAGQELARRGRGRRGKTLKSPSDGVVIQVQDGRIVLQLAEDMIEIPSKLQGEIEAVTQNAVQVAGSGALIQCAWGNGGFCYGVYRFLPTEGFVGLSKLDVRISEFRQTVLISPYPVSKGDLLVAQQQEAAGVVAPSMPSDLRKFAMQLKFPVLLTEGFGQRRPSAAIYNLLQTNVGRQATFDAIVPDRWSWNRPEIIIPLPPGGMTPPAPAVDQPLEVGMQVRVIRAPWDGLMGEVVELPASAQIIDNGLRLPCAKVRFADGRTGLVPLANLELLG